jgi:two-component system KDP operon response regulator KdpE
MPLSILVAVANRPELRRELVDQLTADGHDVHQAHHSRHAVALLAGRHIDVLILGALEHPAAALALLREMRAGTLDARAWPELPTITLAPPVGAGVIDALRAYEAGSDHHLPAVAGYLHQRAVLEVVARRARGATRRVHRVGAIEVDTAAREVRVAGTRVELSAMEFSLLSALASARGACSRRTSCCATSGASGRPDAPGRSTRTPAGCGASSPSTAPRLS